MVDRDNLPPLVRAMCDPRFYPDRPKHVELRQTHISFAFLTDNEVFKVKKNVHFSFLDYSTLEKRRHYCEEEVRLNRRLAPEVYLGVVPVWQAGGNFAPGDAPAPLRGARIIEYAVRMKRLDEAGMLDRRVLDGRAGPDEIRAVARTLVRFHTAASADRAAEYGGPRTIWERVRNNLEELRNFEGAIYNADGEFLLRYSSDFFDRHRALFDARLEAGRVREGHGDLRAEHVNIGPDGVIAIFDCIEFSESLRTCDVASELAFLAMDLDFLGACELSRELIRTYAAEARDPELHELLPFYLTYRALVRCKVESLKSSEEEISGAEREEAQARVRRYADLACRYAGGDRRPALLVTCGLVATGKSHLARRLSDRTGFVLFDSDVIRKRLAGLDAETSAQAGFGQGIYTRDFTNRVYAELASRAEETLRSGAGVILDATFDRVTYRRSLIALAERCEVPLLFIECTAPAEEIRRRLAARREGANTVSDATWEIYERQRESFETLDELGTRQHLVVSTDRPIDTALREVDDFLAPG